MLEYRVILIQSDWCPRRRERLTGSTAMWRAEKYYHKPRNVWDYQKLEAGRIFVRGLEEAWPCQHLDFRLLVSRTMREYISLIVS